MNGRYIIFADDDTDDLELITDFFKSYNRDVHVLQFKNGKEVLKFLDDFAVNASMPLLIVLDINMPRMNGMETLVALRKHPKYKNIPVVMYTTSSNAADEAFCRAHGATWFNKPDSIEAVRHAARILAEYCQIVA
jgi:CheY-like chemotaxis protein